MHIETEELDGCYKEMDALLLDYFAKTIAKEGLPPLNMNWMAYIHLSNSGSLVLITARDDRRKLVGFIMYLVHPHLHHVGVVNAACDIIAVAIEARGKGIARAMMKVAEPILKERGAKFITHQFRTCYDTEPLFPRLGYRLIEQSYLKELK